MSGIDLYPKISLILFGVCFLFWLVWVFKASKQYIHELEELPLHD